MSAVRALPFTGDGVVQAAGADVTFSGFAHSGFTKVIAYHGADATGDVIAATELASATIALPAPIRCPRGIFVDVTGTGKGSVFV